MSKVSAEKQGSRAPALSFRRQVSTNPARPAPGPGPKSAWPGAQVGPSRARGPGCAAPICPGPSDHTMGWHESARWRRRLSPQFHESALCSPAAAAAPAFRMGGFGIGALTGTDSDALSGAARAGPHAMRFQGGGASHEGRICGTNLCSRVTNLWFFVS